MRKKLALLVKIVQEDNLWLLSAAMAFYSFLSVFPALLLFSALFSFVVEDPAVKQRIIGFAQDQLLPEGEKFLQEELNRLVTQKGVFGVVGLAGLLWSASGFFNTLLKSLSILWGIERAKSFVLQRLRAAATILLSSLFLVLSVVVLGLFRYVAARIQIPFVWDILFFFFPFVFSFGCFLFAYHVVAPLPFSKRSIYLGTFVGSFSWEILKRLFAYYLENLASLSALYGSIGSLLALFLWLFFSAQVFFLGAEFIDWFHRLETGRGA